MKKLAIVGSRGYEDLNLVREYVDRLKEDTVVVSGGARGVDAVAAETAHKRGLAYIIYPVPGWEWEKSKAAGFHRNGSIVTEADGVLVFWDGQSNGTRDVIVRTKKAGKWLKVVE